MGTTTADKDPKSEDCEVRDAIRYAYSKSGALRRRFDRAGVDLAKIKGVKDLVRLPTLTKEDLIQEQKAHPPFGDFLAVPLDEIGWVFVSPGPVYVPLPDVGTTARIFSIHGFGKGDIVLNSFSYHLSVAGLLFDQALRSLGVTVIPGGPGNTELQLQVMRELGVTGYVGTGSFLMMLMDQADKDGYDVKKDLRLKKASVTGEMLAPALGRRLEQDFGIAVRQCYGLAEIGTVGYECSARQGFHVNGEWVVVEIIDPETGAQMAAGKVGEVVVTCFSTRFPLVRFRTGDLSSYMEEPCGCGLTSPRLRGVLGRIGQAVKVRGLFLHPKQLDEAAKRISRISSVQAIVSREGARDELRILAVLKDGRLNEDGRKKVEEKLKAGIRELCKLKVDQVDFVDVLPSNAPRIDDRRQWR